MAKVRVKVTFIKEYDLVPEYYDTGMTHEQMAEFDIENLKNQPEWLLDDIKSEDWSYEIIEEEE